VTSNDDGTIVEKTASRNRDERQSPITMAIGLHIWIQGTIVSSALSDVKSPVESFAISAF